MSSSPAEPLSLADLAGRSVGVWGAGREGRATIQALAKADAAEAIVFTDEEIPEPERAEIAALGGLPLSFAHGGTGVDRLSEAEVLVRSPGVSRYRPELEQLAAAGVALTTGTNLFFAAHPGELTIAVTATKGKSTTSSLLAHLLRACGREVELAGNVGAPLLAAIDRNPKPDAWVIELSSFQLSDLQHSPRIGLILNLYPEHMDWHGGEERYFADKLRLVSELSPELAVLNARDERLRAHGHGRAERVIWFGDESGIHVDEEGIADPDGLLYPRDAVPLPGDHNLLNACAALTVLDGIGIDPRGHADALASFEALPHRLQVLGERDGITFVNDSIATTPEATIAALGAFAGRRLAVLVGGFDRGQDYDRLGTMLAASDHVHAVVGIPDNGERILASVAVDGAPGPRLIRAESLEQGVALARAALGERGVVLLSPAAPSFGRFIGFEERGEAFRRASGF